jgi:regulator of cell morphogenesis and NO signaling
MNGMSATVAQIIADTPAAARVFDDHRINYAGEGKDSLDIACQKAGVSSGHIMEEIRIAAQTDYQADPHDWQHAPLRELISHIINAHHAYIENQLPLLEDEIARSAGAHSKDTDEIYDRLRRIFRHFRNEIVRHNKREEMVLFPSIIALEHAVETNWRGPKKSFGFATETIQSMEGEHESVCALLAEMRRIANEFIPPEKAAGAERSLYRDLRDFEVNMRRHFHLENNILFPRAAALEDGKL